MTKEPDKTTVGTDAEYLSGHRYSPPFAAAG